MSERTHNRAGCLICGDVIESTHIHDFVSCSCGNVAVDGGQAYFKRLIGRYESYRELPSASSLERWKQERASGDR